MAWAIEGIKETGVCIGKGSAAESVHCKSLNSTLYKVLHLTWFVCGKLPNRRFSEKFDFKGILDAAVSNLVE